MISGITKFTLDRAGVRRLLKSDEMLNCVKSYADDAVNSLGEGYEISTRRGKTRVNAEIRAVSYKAKRDNLANNTILRAVFGK